MSVERMQPIRSNESSGEEGNQKIAWEGLKEEQPEESASWEYASKGAGNLKHHALPQPLRRKQVWPIRPDHKVSRSVGEDRSTPDNQRCSFCL